MISSSTPSTSSTSRGSGSFHRDPYSGGAEGGSSGVEVLRNGLMIAEGHVLNFRLDFPQQARRSLRDFLWSFWAATVSRAVLHRIIGGMVRYCTSCGILVNLPTHVALLERPFYEWKESGHSSMPRLRSGIVLEDGVHLFRLRASLAAKGFRAGANPHVSSPRS